MLKLLPLLLLCSAALVASAQEPAAEAKIAAAAKATLDAWHAENPEVETRLLHVVCWTPKDRAFPADDRARLTRILKHIQAFYQKEMGRLGLGERTFNLDLDDAGQLVLHRVTGKHAAEHYEKSSGREIRTECLPVLKEAGIDADRETVMILCNLATWDAERLRFRHKSPYYAGGTSRSGTAWQLDSPELDVSNLKLREPLVFDGQYGRISLGRHNSIFIGGMAHELGHAFGLPHCQARPDEAVRGTALMGSGNRTYGEELRGEGNGSFLTLAHGLRLASHPQFSGSVKGLSTRPSASVEDVSVDVEEDAIRVTGTVSGTPDVYAVIAYFDPDGGGDYNATTACAIPDEEGRFTLACSALPHGKPGQCRIVPLHVNGAVVGGLSGSVFRFGYQVADNGTPDVSDVRRKLLLRPIADALVGGRITEADTLIDALDDPAVITIAERLLNPKPSTVTPAKVAPEVKSAPLATLKPEAVNVGWARPTFNRIPDRSLLLESAGVVYGTGIYAHAPARHVYNLGRKWQTLSGRVGLATGHRGSVRFEIKGDGTSLWTSETVRDKASVPFTVRVQNVDAIELLTHPTADGASSDWGLWLEPILSR